MRTIIFTLMIVSLIMAGAVYAGVYTYTITGNRVEAMVNVIPTNTPVPTVTPTEEPKQCKHENAECEVNNSDKVCCPGLVCEPFNENSGNGKCREEEQPTVTPTAQPAVTPEITIVPCEGDCITPTVTVEPTREPEPTIEPTEAPKCHGESYTGDYCGWSPSNQQPVYSAPVCTNTLPKKPVLLYGRKSNTEAVLNWIEDDTNTTKWSVNFGYGRDNMQYGIPYIPKEGRSVEVKGITAANWWFVLCRYNGDDCQVCSNPIDP